MTTKSSGSQKHLPGTVSIFAILLIVGMCSSFLIVGSAILLRALGAVLVTADPLEPSDAAVILSGGDSTRIDEAALLYQEKYMDFVILTETGVSVPEWDTEYSNMMRLKAVQKGIPVAAILITEQSAASTSDEARVTRKLLNQRGFDTLIVITDPYHTLRTRLIFQDIFQDTSIRVIVHPVRSHWYRSADWWQHIAGWKVTLHEYIKLGGYFIGLG